MIGLRKPGLGVTDDAFDVQRPIGTTADFSEMTAVNKGLGVLGWGMVVAGALVLVAWLIPKRRRARPNRRRYRRNAVPYYVSKGDIELLKRCEARAADLQAEVEALRGALHPPSDETGNPYWPGRR